MTDERDEQEEMDSLNELGDEELEPILSEGEETDPNEGDEKASEDFDEPDEENPWEYSTRFAGLTDEEIVSQAQQHDDAAVEYYCTSTKTSCVLRRAAIFSSALITRTSCRRA